MRKPVQIALGVVVVLLIGATSVLFMRYQKATADYREVKASEESARARYDQTIDAIAEIQDSLNAISLGDSNVKMISQELQSEQNLSGPSGQKALDRIAVLRSSIMRNRERIRQLESSLKASGIKVAGLQRMIGNLKQTVAEKQEMMAQLSGQVDALHNQVQGLQTEVQQTQDTLVAREQTLEERRRELATVYYVVGTKKELAEAGVIQAKGGVLGLGKTILPTGKIDETTFTPLDTDANTVVQTPSQKARVISAQPPSSYELRLVDGRMELHIIDPREFRKVKQLVILTA
jgi:uncharacterized coiled-coil protein SlyX